MTSLWGSKRQARSRLSCAMCVCKNICQQTKGSATAYNFVWLAPATSFMLLVVLLTLAAAWRAQAKHDALWGARVGFEPLKETLTMLVNTPVESPCKIAQSAAFITYANEHMFHLLVMQRRAMELSSRGGTRTCLEKRVTTVCLDTACLKLCEIHSVPNCVDLKITTDASNFLSEDYVWITYVKHEIIAAALSVCKEVFFVDTDTLIFDDPWTVDLSLPAGPYDLRFQAESGAGGARCDEMGSNGGQIYVRQTPAAQAYLVAMLSHKDDIRTGGHLDQDYIISAAQASNASYCGLNPEYFLGHCGGSHVAVDDVRKVVIYHVNCATAETKTPLLRHFYETRKAAQELSLTIDDGQADG